VPGQRGQHGDRRDRRGSGRRQHQLRGQRPRHPGLGAYPMSDGIFTEEELKAEAATEVIEPVAEETAEQKEQRERDEQGRFKAKEPVEGEVGAEVVEEGKDKGNTVPQQALHAEREKRKGVEAELA